MFPNNPPSTLLFSISEIANNISMSRLLDQRAAQGTAREKRVVGKLLARVDGFLQVNKTKYAFDEREHEYEDEAVESVGSEEENDEEGDGTATPAPEEEGEEPVCSICFEAAGEAVTVWEDPEAEEKYQAEKANEGPSLMDFITASSAWKAAFGGGAPTPDNDCDAPAPAIVHTRKATAFPGLGALRYDVTPCQEGTGGLWRVCTAEDQKCKEAFCVPCLTKYFTSTVNNAFKASCPILTCPGCKGFVPVRCV